MILNMQWVSCDISYYAALGNFHENNEANVVSLLQSFMSLPFHILRGVPNQKLRIFVADDNRHSK